MSSSAHPQTRPVWLIIGATSGIGQEIARKVQPFATVIAVGRNQSALEGLAKIGCKTVQLDLTSSDAIVRRAIDDMIRQEGFIDFVVNVAGYLLEGGVEEHGDMEIQHVFETHVFGPLRLFRAVLPYMRAEKRGVIAHLAGIGGFQGAPNAGVFCASKAAAATVIEAFQKEVAPLGIRMCLIQLGHFRTPFLAQRHRREVQARITDYDPVLEPIRDIFNNFDGAQQGDPVKAANVIVEALTKDANNIPLLLPVGPDVPAAELKAHEVRVENMASLRALTDGTDL